MAANAAKSSVLRGRVFLHNAPSKLTSRAYSYFAPARRRCVYGSRRPDILACGMRTLSTTSRRYLANVKEMLDPRQQDRESDEVDVCIVGGGNYVHAETDFVC